MKNTIANSPKKRTNDKLTTELRTGMKFKSIYLQDKTITITHLDAVNNVLDVVVKDDIDNTWYNDNNWNLEHTLWGFERAEYYV